MNTFIKVFHRGESS